MAMTITSFETAWASSPKLLYIYIVLNVLTDSGGKWQNIVGRSSRSKTTANHRSFALLNHLFLVPRHHVSQHCKTNIYVLLALERGLKIER